MLRRDPDRKTEEVVAQRSELSKGVRKSADISKNGVLLRKRPENDFWSFSRRGGNLTASAGEKERVEQCMGPFCPKKVGGKKAIFRRARSLSGGKDGCHLFPDHHGEGVRDSSQGEGRGGSRFSLPGFTGERNII